MAERKSFLLRMDRELLDAVQRWANDDLRSLNGQIEFLLRRSLQQAGRQPARRTSESMPTRTTLDDSSVEDSLNDAPVDETPE